MSKSRLVRLRGGSPDMPVWRLGTDPMWKTMLTLLSQDVCSIHLIRNPFIEADEQVQ